MTTDFRNSFLGEFITAISMIGFGGLNLMGAETGLHSIIALYLFVAGFFLFALAVRRRRGPPGDLPDSANGLSKAIEKLSGSKPFGFTMLAVAPLPLGFGGLGLVVFLFLYLMSVNAMRPSDAELKSWVFREKKE